MAFEPKKDDIKRALNDNKTVVNSGTIISVPVYDENLEEEKTKTYAFTLQPSIRHKLDTIAKEHNYKSSSKFLNDLIKRM